MVYGMQGVCVCVSLYVWCACLCGVCGVCYVVCVCVHVCGNGDTTAQDLCMLGRHSSH